ncbi:thiamine pyrophosphokinase 1-like [Phalaenopsis equestris]|uniref:thiamine pyrophosphokinase 1-like n=1 Tax=Phalaenopsis equestris TaxID=78828 RepID=UPI0009E57A00|nr:thiamine pyrophosphokinase 1-like [Phalaenopsis equestris]
MEAMRHASTFLLSSSVERAGDLSPPDYALVVLNRPLLRFAPLLWERAKLRVCADGGANSLFDGMPELFPEEDPEEVRLKYKPDVIIGDLDSISTKVKDFYSDLGVKIVRVTEQEFPDLHKCVAFICDCTPSLEKSNLHILVAGALGGRFDHEMGNINVLYHFSNMRIILLSDHCLIYLLPKTHRHEIYIQSSVEGPRCGLIPFGAPASSITTTGLQWDLTEGSMHFGGLESTSNSVREEKITVHSDSDLLWTISIRKPR